MSEHQELSKWFKLDLGKRDVVWRQTPPHTPECTGISVGGIDYNGGRVVWLAGKQYRVARLAHFLYYGRWPTGVLYNQKELIS